MNTVQGGIPEFSGFLNCEKDKRKFDNEVKDQLKIELTLKNQGKWITHVKVSGFSLC